MNIQTRILILTKQINWYFNHEIYQKALWVSYNDREKIEIGMQDSRYFVRERRKGRGIQARRIVNFLINNGFVSGKPMKSKTVVWGKDNFICEHSDKVAENQPIQSSFWYDGAEYNVCMDVPTLTCDICLESWLTDKAVIDLANAKEQACIKMGYKAYPNGHPYLTGLPLGFGNVSS